MIQTCNRCGSDFDKSKIKKRSSICKECINAKARENYVSRRKVQLVTITINQAQVITKACTKCRTTKPLVEFDTDRTGLGGRRSSCKICDSLSKTNRVRRPRDETDKQKSRVYYEENRERILTTSKRRYRLNPEHCKAVIREWRLNNPEKFNANQQRRRARVRELPSTLSNAEWRSVLDRFGGVCALTGRADVSMDHFIPISIGHGGTVLGNVYPLDRSLNSSKNAKNPFQWVREPEMQLLIAPERWDNLVRYLASQNDMEPTEFVEYVNWCFEHSRKVTSIGNAA